MSYKVGDTYEEAGFTFKVTNIDKQVREDGIIIKIVSSEILN